MSNPNSFEKLVSASTCSHKCTFCGKIFDCNTSQRAAIMRQLANHYKYAHKAVLDDVFVMTQNARDLNRKTNITLRQNNTVEILDNMQMPSLPTNSH